MPPFAYEMHEMAHLAWAPARAVSDMARTWLEHPGNPLSYTAAGRNSGCFGENFRAGDQAIRQARIRSRHDGR